MDLASTFASMNMLRDSVMPYLYLKSIILTNASIPSQPSHPTNLEEYRKYKLHTPMNYAGEFNILWMASIPMMHKQ